MSDLNMLLSCFREKMSGCRDALRRRRMRLLVAAAALAAAAAVLPGEGQARGAEEVETCQQGQTVTNNFSGSLMKEGGFCREGVTLEPAYKVHGCKVFSDVRSIFGWSQSKSAIVGYNPDVRSARL